MTAEEKSFLQNIWDNRFVKFTLPYVVGAWGIIQVTAFLESRYSWANGWPDFVLFFGLLMLPSVLLFSYYRTNSAHSLSKIEKIFFPINLLLAIVLSFFGLGNTAVEGTNISVVNEAGEVEERYIPNSNSIKRIVLIPWENKSSNTDIQWLTFALPQVLSSDMEQDSRVVAVSPQLLNRPYQEYNVQLNEAPPFSIQRKIALDNYSNYFMNGSIEKEGDNYKVIARLINTDDGKEFYNKSYEDKDPLTIIDRISEDFRKEVYVENELDENFIDLPVSNLYTNSLEALQAYMEGVIDLYFKNNLVAAVPKVEAAIKLDQKFAVAHSFLGNCYMNNNESVKGKAAFRKAMSLKDMLSERMQFVIKYYDLAYQDPVKSVSLLEMWSQLYPMDYLPYNFLISSYNRNNELDKSKHTAMRALENGHSGQLLLVLADMENKQGNYEKSKEYYTRFDKEFPHKKKDVFGRGNIYMSQGNFDKAQEHFEKMYLMESDNASVIRKLAEIQGKKGNFEKQLQLYDEALANEKQYSDSVYIFQQKEAVYYKKGQINQYFSKMEERWASAEKAMPGRPHRMELLNPVNVLAMVNQEGRTGILEELLETAKMLKNTLEGIDCMAKGNYYIFAEDAENLNKSLEECQEKLQKYQTDVQNNMVSAYAAKVNGKYEEALKYMLLAQQGSKVKDGSFALIGELYLLKKDYRNAFIQLNESLKVDPYDPDFLYLMALTKHGMGNIEDAKASLQKALDVWKDADDNFIPAKKAKAKMKEWN